MIRMIRIRLATKLKDLNLKKLTSDEIQASRLLSKFLGIWRQSRRVLAFVQPATRSNSGGWRRSNTIVVRLFETTALVRATISASRDALLASRLSAPVDGSRLTTVSVDGSRLTPVDEGIRRGVLLNDLVIG